MEAKEFPKELMSVEKAEWSSFVLVVQGFLDNHVVDNHVEVVETLVGT